LEYCAKSELHPRSGLGMLKGRKKFLTDGSLDQRPLLSNNSAALVRRFVLVLVVVLESGHAE
jgi:hypothetical protein